MTLLGNSHEVTVFLNAHPVPGGTPVRVTGPNGYDEMLDTGTGGTLRLISMPVGTYTITFNGISHPLEVLPNFIDKVVRDIGDGDTRIFTVQHDLGSEDVEVRCRDKSTQEFVMPTVVAAGPDAVTVTFGSPPAPDQYAVSVRL